MHWPLLITSPDNLMKPFSGKQLVVVGEFLQLHPVPNVFDEGCLLLESPIFGKLLPHRYELTTVIRQDPSELQLLTCLKELRQGKCSKDNERFIKENLSKDLDKHLNENAIHIFFKKTSVMFFNNNMMQAMPGEFLRFVAIDEGNIRNIRCMAEHVLVLKSLCKIMLIWNISDTLRNGSSGIFLEESEGQLLVDFPGIGKVRLNRVSWHKCTTTGHVIGTRTQYPVVPMYAITCHKSQGLTLPSVIVHCSKEFVPGLTYVAFSRVERAAHLQVIGFSPDQLLPQREECLHVCDSHSDPGDNLECCRDNMLTEQDLKVADRCKDVGGNEEMLEEADERFVQVTEGLVSSYYERGEPDEQVVDLQTVYWTLSEDQSNSMLLTPPENFNITLILQQMKIDEPLSEFAKQQNEELDILIQMNNNKEVMGQILWCRACQIVIEG